MLASKVAALATSNESAEDRKRRERKQAEEADNALADELFDNVSSKGSGVDTGPGKKISGLGSTSLRNKQDHLNFAALVAAKLSDSTTFCLFSFYKELTDKIKSSLALENLSEIIGILEALRVEKSKKEEVQKPVAKKTTKQLKAERRKHEDVFGGSFDDDFGGQGYDDIEDAYQF